MANRHLLAHNDLPEFENWLKSKGWTILEPVGGYEALRASNKPGGFRYPLIVYYRTNGGNVHLSLLDRDEHIVAQFYKDKKSKKLEVEQLNEPGCTLTLVKNPTMEVVQINNVVQLDLANMKELGDDVSDDMWNFISIITIENGEKKKQVIRLKDIWQFTIVRDKGDAK